MSSVDWRQGGSHLHGRVYCQPSRSWWKLATQDTAPHPLFQPTSRIAKHATTQPTGLVSAWSMVPTRIFPPGTSAQDKFVCLQTTSKKERVKSHPSYCQLTFSNIILCLFNGLNPWVYHSLYGEGKPWSPLPMNPLCLSTSLLSACPYLPGVRLSSLQPLQ